MAWTVLALAWGLAAADAGPFEPVRSRDALPAREVERPPVTPMGWTRASAGLSWTTWAPDPSRRRGERGLGLELRHGLQRRVEGWLDVGVAADVEPSATRRSFEGASFGLRGVVAQREVGGTWLAWKLGYHAPWDPVGPVTSSADLGVTLRQRVGALRLDLDVQAGPTLPGTYGAGGFGGCSAASTDRGWAGWGWTSRGSVRGLLQAGPLLGLGGLDGDVWSDRRVQGQAPRWTDPGCVGSSKGLEDAVASGGYDVVARAGGGLQVSRGAQGTVVVELPVSAERSEDDRFHGLTGPRTIVGVEIAF